ncbi:hypothetical protein SPHINGO361_140209 [Sphingomonas sp. EC-HK361]|nr:hypothetical protein SPHINGO361_140209 [Sphingomonas sp. EC-HK361]
MGTLKLWLAIGCCSRRSARSWRRSSHIANIANISFPRAASFARWPARLPRTVGEAEAMRDTPKARALTAPDGVEAVRGQGTGRDVIACGGRARRRVGEGPLRKGSRSGADAAL